VTIDQVLAKIKKARKLRIQSLRGYCAVCHKSTVRAVAIYEPREDVLPLCRVHLDEVEEAVQQALERTAKKD